MAVHRLAPLVACLTAAGAARSQLQPGYYLATHASAQTAGTIDVVQVTPTGATRPVRSQLGSIRLEAATRTRNPSEILVGAANSSGVRQLLIGTVRGDVIVSARPFGLGRLRTAIRRIRLLPSGHALVATSTGLYEFSPSAGLRTLLPPVTGRTILDLDYRDGSMIALLNQRSGSISSTALAVSRPYNPSGVRVVRVPTQAPVALAVQPGGSLAHVSTSRGGIQQIDLARFAITAWPTLTIGVVLAFGFDTDRARIALTTRTRLHHAVGRRVDAGVPLPASHRSIQSLEYRAYTSAFRTYGAGCVGTNGRNPVLGADGRPFPGNRAFAITLSAAPVGQPCVLNIGTRQLRLDLTGLGMPGCFAWSDSILRLPATIGTSQTVQPLPIPANPSNAGVLLYSYWVVVDPRANRLGLTTSNGGRIGL